VGRHYLKDEAESQEDSATPPADGREKISGLPNADERIRRGARSTEACGEAAALPALQKDGCHNHQAIDDENGQKKRVKH
jgi:hypothetical protein